jgi:hypothetical protein
MPRLFFDNMVSGNLRSRSASIVNTCQEKHVISISVPQPSAISLALLPPKDEERKNCNVYDDAGIKRRYRKTHRKDIPSIALNVQTEAENQCSHTGCQNHHSAQSFNFSTFTECWKCKFLATYIVRTYAEEENCKAIFRRSGSEFIILRMHLWQKTWRFSDKKCILGGWKSGKKSENFLSWLTWNRALSWKLFFSVGNQFFFFFLQL